MAAMIAVRQLMPLSIAYIDDTCQYVSMTCPRPDHLDEETLRAYLIEAEREYRQTKDEDYVIRVIRNSMIVRAHRGGLHQREISELVGDMGQPNVARTVKRERAITRHDLLPGGMLAPDDALDRSGLSPSSFMRAVRQGHLQPKPTGYPGVLAFLPEDVRALAENGTR